MSTKTAEPRERVAVYDCGDHSWCELRSGQFVFGRDGAEISAVLDELAKRTGPARA